MKTLALLFAFSACAPAADPWISLPGGDGPGKGKHVVLVSGDEEYRSEQAMAQLGKILAARHGFRCTILFAIDPQDGSVNPNIKDNIPGLEALKTADLMVIFTRFRDLPDEQMQHVVDYMERGKPVIGLRTATHAFAMGKGKKFTNYHWQSKQPGWEGGFGRAVLGETWVAHHGGHGKEGTRGIVVKGQEANPILRGIEEGSIFGTSDVYTVKLPESCTPLVYGQVTDSLKPDSKAVGGTKNDPMMPVTWTTTFGKARVLTTTMGAAEDLSHEGTRRMLVNGCYWALGLDAAIPAKSDVTLVGEYEPLPFKNNGFRKGATPADYAK